MAYELRVAGTTKQFDSEAEAVEAAKQAFRDDPNAEPEIIDLATGNPAAPGASREWRDELKSKAGF